MANKIRETIDLAEVQLNELRTTAAKAEARERFAMEIFDDLRDYLDVTRLTSSLETRIVAFLSGRTPQAQPPASEEGGG